MSFADAEAAIITLFSTAWTTTPIAFENVQFDPTSAASCGAFPTGGPWVELNVQEVASAQISTPGIQNGTGRLYRSQGLISVIARVPTGYGKYAVTSMVTSAADIFRGYTALTASGHMIILAPFQGRGHTDVAGAWFAAVMTVRFWHDVSF